MLLLRFSYSIISYHNVHRMMKVSKSLNISAWAWMTELSLIIGIEYICNISSLITLRINHFYHWFCKGIPNRLPKQLFALSAEHALQDRNSGIRIILGVNVIGLMNEVDELISSMTHDSFGWWILLSICIRYSLCGLTP